MGIISVIFYDRKILGERLMIFSSLDDDDIRYINNECIESIRVDALEIKDTTEILELGVVILLKSGQSLTIKMSKKEYFNMILRLKMVAII
jgi:hypothetical protein